MQLSPNRMSSADIPSTMRYMPMTAEMSTKSTFHACARVARTNRRLRNRLICLWKYTKGAADLRFAHTCADRFPGTRSPLAQCRTNSVVLLSRAVWPPLPSLDCIRERGILGSAQGQSLPWTVQYLFSKVRWASSHSLTYELCDCLALCGAISPYTLIWD